jgi:hypothetical protein
MLMTSNSLAKRVLSGLVFCILVFVIGVTPDSYAADKSQNVGYSYKTSRGPIFLAEVSQTKIDKQHLELFRGVSQLTSESKNVETFSVKTLERNIGQYSMIRVITKNPVNLLGALTPTIMINGVPHVTRFTREEMPIFFALVNNNSLKKSNQIQLSWNGESSASKKQAESILLLK